MMALDSNPCPMTNHYAKELLTLMTNRYDLDQVGMTMGQYLEKNTTLKGRPFSFNRYPYQRAVVDDDHNNQVGVKPSQVGWSEIIQRWAAAFLKRNRATKGIYAYPDDDMRKKNVQTRFMPILDNNKVFNMDTGSGKPIRSIELLQVDKSYLYVTGSKVGDATSTDADFVLLDEYDLHNMQVAALFQSRLQNSEWKIKKYFSTPTYTEFGVDQLYRDSDQMEYLIKCDACNHWMFPLFTPEFIHIPNLSLDINDLIEIDQTMIDSHRLALEDSYVCCERCRAPLDLGREDNRAWVAKYPSRRQLRGRRINCFSVATRPVVDIVTELQDYKRKDFIRGFKNSVLGEAEDSSSARISEADIRMCIGSKEVPTIRTDLPTWVGIDMGHNCHITVGQGYSIEEVKVVRWMVVPIGQLKQTIVELDGTYMIVGGHVDRHPESQAAADVRDMTHRRILPCEYRGSKEINPIKGPEGEDDIVYIQADRTMLLDEVAKAIRQHSIIFEGYLEKDAEIIVHLRNMVRVEAPETPAVWTKLDAQDHFFHSLGFMLTAMKTKRILGLKLESPQTFIGIAGADNNSYNGDIYGNSTGQQSAWQTNYLRLGRRL
jgi:hypothetical protein